MPNDAPEALTLSKVSAHFEDANGKNIPALKDISFSIRAGSFVSIAGPSGAGKSTLLRVILGLMPLGSGAIARNFNRPAMVFQNYALFPWETALGNAAFGLRMSGMPKKDREKIAREKLNEVGLSHLERHYPAELSGGQRQRIGLARALAGNPDFLALDEPFSNLDSITADELKRDILALWERYRMTILMVNHLVPDAIELSDQVIVMSAHPGEVKKVIDIGLPRPRDTRSPAFFKPVDELTGLLRERPA